MIDDTDRIERFANIVVDVDFKCPAPQLQINYLYSFLGLYQHSKSVFKAVNEYALIGEATESEGERRFQKTVVFTGLDSKFFRIRLTVCTVRIWSCL